MIVAALIDIFFFFVFSWTVYHFGFLRFRVYLEKIVELHRSFGLVCCSYPNNRCPKFSFYFLEYNCIISKCKIMHLTMKNVSFKLFNDSIQFFIENKLNVFSKESWILNPYLKKNQVLHECITISPFKETNVHVT